MAMAIAYPPAQNDPYLTVRERPDLRVDERLVWWIWQTRRFDSSRARERGFDVVFPGWPSTTAGPDFRDAIIATADGALGHGDVEIHTHASDWFAHRHHQDAAYDRVRLHVVLVADQLIPACTSSGRVLDQLELGSILLAPLSDLERHFTNEAPEIVHCPQIAAAADTTEVIEAAGMARFEDKTLRLRSDVEAVGSDEALYRLLAESMGYSVNRAAFRKIAEAVPFALLSSLSLFEAERLLLSAAGLASAELLSPFIDRPVLAPGELVTFRVRPGNAPRARLRALARLVNRHRAGIGDALRDADAGRLHELFLVEADDVLVGKGRALDIVINIALPYLSAYHGLDGVLALKTLSAPADNRWVSSLRAKLSGDGIQIRPYRALHQQGLLHLALRFCRFDHCEACPLHQSGGTPKIEDGDEVSEQA